MKPLRIVIAPELRDLAGPAVNWIWRQCLAAIGYPWQEVGIEDPCDIAYVVNRSQAAHAKIGIVATPARWRDPARYRLSSITAGEAPLFMRFIGETCNAPLVRTENGGWWLPRDVIFDLFWWVTGQEEQHWPKDIHSFYTAPRFWLKQRILEQAPASAIIASLAMLLKHAGLGDPLPRWPQGKRAAAAITHDVDYPEVVRWLEPLRIISRQHWHGVNPAWEVLSGQRDYWTFSQWMAFEEHYGVRSAFYFVARQGSLLEYALGTPDPFYNIAAPQFRALFRRLIEGGWEVGMHASYMAYASHERFAAEKQRLEHAAGAPVFGNRHHYWHVSPVQPEETLQLHAKIGLLYDTSLTHDHHLGWRRGINAPFYPYAPHAQREIGTLQLPVAWMDAQLAQRSDLTQQQREAIVCDLVDRAAVQQGLFVANVHDYVFDEVLYPGWLATLRAALERIVARGDFWVATPITIARHWSDRYQQLLTLSSGLWEGR